MSYWSLFKSKDYAKCINNMATALAEKMKRPVYASSMIPNAIVIFWVNMGNNPYFPEKIKEYHWKAIPRVSFFTTHQHWKIYNKKNSCMHVVLNGFQNNNVSRLGTVLGFPTSQWRDNIQKISLVLLKLSASTIYQLPLKLS